MRRATLRHWASLVAVTAGLVAGSPAWAATYKIDPAHSTVEFKVKHMFSYVRGTFNDFAGQFDYEPDHPELWKAAATIQAASIDTRVDQRDEHLRSKDFFEVETYPAITFTSTQVTDATPTSAKLRGVLKMHGVERPIIMDLEILGSGKDPRGQTRSSFTATTRVNRKDFGVVWNKVLETGQLLVGEDVEITIDVEGVAQE